MADSSAREVDSFICRSEIRPCFASSVSASACRRACLAFACTVAYAAFWSRSWLCSFTLRLASSASAALSCHPASMAALSSSGLLSSRMTDSVFTAVPGLIRICSTRPSVAAGIQRISSGTSVPSPRT